MKKVLSFGKENIQYEIRKNAFSKSIKLHVYRDGRILVTVPKWSSYRAGERFVETKIDWIEQQLSHARKYERPDALQSSQSEFHRHKEAARRFVQQKVNEHNEFYRFPFNKIFIRNTRSRWGSCSSKKNLNFHYKILFLPEPLADYLIVHELCHLEEMNHSNKFWSLVAESIPDHRDRRRELRRNPLNEGS